LLPPPFSLPHPPPPTPPPPAAHVLAGLTGAWPVDPSVAGDLLHEPPRLRAMAASGALVTELRSQGAHAWLSGAGPTVAALFDAVDRAALAPARGAAAALGFTTHEVGFDLAGVLACPDDGCAISGVRGCVQCPRQRV
jgi:homoserine kinase